MEKLSVFEDVGMAMGAERKQAFNQFNEMVYKGTIVIETVSQCFCEVTDFQLLSRYDRFGLPFGTQICRSCGLISQTLRIAPGSLAQFYEKIYWPLISGKGGYLTAPKKDETSSYILKHIPKDWKTVNVFEVGCGAGERISMLSDELKKTGLNVSSVGCDYSSEALKHAEFKEIQTIQGGMDELLLAGKADILILSHVFEHFPDLSHALQQIKSLIHDDSLIYIEVPGVVDLENKKEYLYNYQLYCVLAHTFNFSLSTLSSVMSKNGFILLEGDEYVRTVFRLGEVQGNVESGYLQIMGSLKRAYANQLALDKKRNHPVFKSLRNIAKALLGRDE